MSATALARLTSAAANTDVVDVTLTAAPHAFNPVARVAFAGLAYNGSIPGPVLRLRHGQRLRVRYVNRTGESSSIHWHGMILPNRVDGVPDVTQRPVPNGGTFVYEFSPDPPGTRWYHSHSGTQAVRGLVGAIVVEDPRDEHADQDIVVVFHDVPSMGTFERAMGGTSSGAMVDPLGSPELAAMKRGDKMGDEPNYVAHCINGAVYPKTKPIVVKVGERVRLRVLNANLTQTRYVRLAGHTLRVTHSDGNRLPQAVEIDALRVGAAERYDAWFELTQPGAFLLQSLSTDPLAFEQAVVVATPGMERTSPLSVRATLDGVRYFTYELAGGLGGKFVAPHADVTQHYELGGGKYGSARWTMNGKVWPNTTKIRMRRGQRALVSFKNTSDMHHPMHLHGHVFEIVEINGRALAKPLPKDVSLVDPDGGTMTWSFDATSPGGRWLLHCHNDVHMMDGMMTEVVYA
jgi:multicopper oxidase